MPPPADDNFAVDAGASAVALRAPSDAPASPRAVASSTVALSCRSIVIAALLPTNLYRESGARFIGTRGSLADLAMAMRTISEGFDALRSPFNKVLGLGRVARLALVATKADHITADQINNLVGLLRDMIGEPIMQ